MPKKAKIINDGASTHYQTCALHDDEAGMKCGARLSRGGNCTKKATRPFADGVMPRCKLHDNKIEKAGRCQAVLPCQSQCNRIFAWRPHGFPACPEHRKDFKACYFCKVPPEIRQEIYRYLLPDQLIPSEHYSPRALRRDGERVAVAFFLVNRMIHDEISSLLYGHTGFIVNSRSCNSLRIANKCSPFVNLREPAATDETRFAGSLLDYKKQIMALEQKNKELFTGPSNSQNTTSRPLTSNHILATSQPQNLAQVSSITGSLQQFWAPSLAQNYFNMIRSFYLDINIFGPYYSTSLEGVQNENPFHVGLYTRCDDLHKFIARLLINSSISRLQIRISLAGKIVTCRQAWEAARVLIKPFKRLHGKLDKLQVLSIHYDEGSGKEIDLLNALGESLPESTENRALAEEIQCWLKELPHAAASTQSIQLLDAYWQLEDLISKIRSHYANATGIGRRNTKLVKLHMDARVAREDDDIERFKRIWTNVTSIRNEFLKLERRFEKDTTTEMNALLDTLNR